jgi:hypothetical protein
MARKPTLEDKDPEETRSYGIDWEPALNSATISSSLFTVVSGSATLAGSTNTTTTTEFALTGGTIGETVEVENKISTSASETLKKSVLIRIRNL